MTLPATDRDPSADPGADFYRYANGGWLDANPIPAGYGSWGSFEEVSGRNEVVLRELLERAAAEPDNALDRLLGDAFAAGLDLDAIERHGIEPIAPLLEAIAREDPATVLPELHRSGIFPFFGADVTADHDDSTRNLLWLTQTRLGLPDRESYFDDKAADLRDAYVEHVAAQLANAGVAADATRILALETRLAELHLKAEDRRDPDKTHNRHDRAALEALAPGLNAYLEALGAGAAETVNVENPALLGGLHDILAATDDATVRAYLAFTVVRALADALPARVDDEDFAFYGRRIRGQQEPHERVKRVIDAIGEDLGEALAQRYVERTFPPEAKERAEHMVAAILGEMRASLQTRAWMSEETRARGEAKLDRMRVKIGYPERWRDWSGLAIGRDAYAANRLNAARFEIARRLAKLGEPVDRDEWEMPAHIVNAYYHPTLNEIVLPAGILQAPLFDAAGRRRRQLRRHRDGRRPRGHARVRRPGPPLRRARPPARLVDRRGRGPLQGARRPARRPVRRLHGARRRAGQWAPDARREHRRPRWPAAGRARPRACLRKRAGHRRADARAALLPCPRDALAGEHQPRAAADARRDRSAQPAPAARGRPGVQPRHLPRRVRPHRRRSDHAPAAGEDRDLVSL